MLSGFWPQYNNPELSSAGGLYPSFLLVGMGAYGSRNSAKVFYIRYDVHYEVVCASVMSTSFHFLWFHKLFALSNIDYAN
jgi:hypothetical protein